MSYAEILLYCHTKEDFIKLCEILNSLKPSMEKDWGACAFLVGMHAKPIHVLFPDKKDSFMERTMPGYYVLLGGKQYPVQTHAWIEQYVNVHFASKSIPVLGIDAKWCAEVLSGELYKNIKCRKFNKIQKNDMGKVIVLDMKRPIDLDLVRIL